MSSWFSFCNCGCYVNMKEWIVDNQSRWANRFVIGVHSHVATGNCLTITNNFSHLNNNSFIKYRHCCCCRHCYRVTRNRYWLLFKTRVPPRFTFILCIWRKSSMSPAWIIHSYKKPAYSLLNDYPRGSAQKNDNSPTVYF